MGQQGFLFITYNPVGVEQMGGGGGGAENHGTAHPTSLEARQLIGTSELF